MNTIDFLNANKGTSSFLAQAQYVRDNWAWLKYSYAIAIKVRSRMEELGWSQKQLAEEIGCTQQHISVLLNGRVNMTLETIAKLEEALGLSLLKSILNSLEKPDTHYYLNDPVPDEPRIDIDTRSLTDGYRPRKKKGPKK